MNIILLGAALALSFIIPYMRMSKKYKRKINGGSWMSDVIVSACMFSLASASTLGFLVGAVASLIASVFLLIARICIGTDNILPHYRFPSVSIRRKTSG